MTIPMHRHFSLFLRCDNMAVPPSARLLSTFGLKNELMVLCKKGTDYHLFLGNFNQVAVTHTSKQLAITK
jgi:hypothetical protein